MEFETEEKQQDILDSTEIRDTRKDWPFQPGDWMITDIFTDPEMLYKLMTIKNYKYNQVYSLVLEIYNKVEKKRKELEEKDAAFMKKKAYLLNAEAMNNKKIQITLEGEYSLKKYISLYKIYELISFCSRLRDEYTIFKICVLEKQKLVEKIVPLLDLSIRKVIGAKIVSVKSDQFEDAVSNAWFAIINYLPKIDPARVIFSIAVSVAHKSAYFFMARQLKHTYHTVQLSVLEDKMSKDDDIEGEFFLTSAANKNEGINADSIEEDLADKVDMNTQIEQYQEMVDYINAQSIETYDDKVFDENEMFGEGTYGMTDRNDAIEQRILSYSFTVLSGKIRKICYTKIYAEFFIDLINHNIPQKLISKYANLFLNVINFDELSSLNTDDTKINDSLIRLLKGWIKAKQEAKLKENVTKTNKYDKRVEREQEIYEYIRDNKNALDELVRFRKDCLQFKLLGGEEE